MTSIVNELIVFENGLIEWLGWPSWALRTIATLTILVSLTGMFQSLVESPSTTENGANGAQHKQITWEFRLFQLQYLTVFLIIMLADWLQGTNMYTLYSVSEIIAINYTS
jgi:hypothetical protein